MKSYEKVHLVKLYMVAQKCNFHIRLNLHLHIKIEIYILAQHETLKLNLNLISTWGMILEYSSEKQPPRGVPRKKFSKNMHQIYRGAPMPKCDLNKVS